MFRLIFHTFLFLMLSFSALAESDRPRASRLTIESIAPEGAPTFDELNLSCGASDQDLGMLITNAATAKFFAQLLGQQFGQEAEQAVLEEWYKLNKSTAQKQAFLKVYLVDDVNPSCQSHSNEGGGGGVVIETRFTSKSNMQKQVMKNTSARTQSNLGSEVFTVMNKKGGGGGIVVIRNFSKLLSHKSKGVH